MIELGKPEPGTPGWWMKRLLTRLDARRPYYEGLWRYYDGSHSLSSPTTKEVREAYRRLMRMARTNYGELVVEAVRERLMPAGFRTGAVSDPMGDAEAWRVWQGNGLDADCDLVHRPFLVMGAAYVIVGPRDPDTGVPVITPEDPRQVIAEMDPVRRRRVNAGLKVFRDDVAGVDRCYLYLPGEVHRATRTAAARTDPAGRTVTTASPTNILSGWEQDGPPQRLPANLAGRVPVVPFLNRPDATGDTTSELGGHVGLLDRITYTMLNRLEIATLQAFRQRAVKGVPLHDETGADINYDDIFSMDPAALWVLPDTAEIWESGQVDLSGLRQSIRDDVQDLAAVTRTPLFYLTPEATNGSAEGAALSREGLVFKAQDRIRALSDPWEDVMALAFAWAGDDARAARSDMEVLWEPPERYSLSERADAASKATAGGLTWEQVMALVWQLSPQEIARAKVDRAQAAFLAAALAPPQSPPVGAAPAGEAGRARGGPTGLAAPGPPPPAALPIGPASG
jgi:hypothetical protein